MMKPGTIVVNCARGGIVNENDLAEALSNDVIGGAGLDVFVGERLDPESALAKAPHLICTPHMAAQTDTAVEQICLMMVKGTMAVLRGENGRLLRISRFMTTRGGRESTGRRPEKRRMT